MKQKAMYFKGRKIYVEVDQDGSMVLEGGRAVMRYRPDDEKTYGPWPANLSESPGEQKTQAGSPAPRTPAKRKKPATAATIEDKNAVVAYTDGACLGNPGPAGLGYLVTYPDGKSLKAGEPLGQGTNNIAELTAIERVLEIVDPSEKLVIHTDSSYSIGVLTQGWKAKANKELIARIKGKLARFAHLELRKVKGHAGIEENELVDELARDAAQAQAKIE